jgi:aquaporin Z
MQSLIAALRRHWPEYGIEALGLGVFMMAAVGGTVLLQHPASPLYRALPDPLVRRALMGVAMGATAIVLVYSPFGQRSGAHFNPAFTVTFFRLGRVAPADALFYAIAQFAGAIAGVAAIGALLGAFAAHPVVRYAATLPGASEWAAFAAEVAISFGLMTTVLIASNTPALERFTGVLCGALIALYITFEAPVSGMSMNPARTLGSAASAGVFASIWIYFVAPPVGMLLAAELFVRLRGARAVHCAKLNHQGAQRCIFRCTRPMQAAR